MRQLAKNNNTLEDQLLKQTRESERLLHDNVQLRQRLAQLSAENDSLRWKQFGENNHKKKTLLIGDSLLRDVDEKKLKSTEVEVISGGRLTDVLKRLQRRDGRTAASSCTPALMTAAVTTRTKQNFARLKETLFSWPKRALLRKWTSASRVFHRDATANRQTER